MADLLDIAPSTAVETVTLSDGQQVTVHRLHADNIAFLAARFPDLVMLLVGGDDMLARLFAKVGAAVVPIIAAAGGHPGDEKAEQIAGTLLLEDQFKLLTVIYRLTFPNGLAALVEAMAGLMTGAADEKPKPIKVPLKQSPSVSPLSSDAASRPIMQ
jgi:hypothetical protein